MQNHFQNAHSIQGIGSANTMSSVQIAQLTNKSPSNLMKSIRKMEETWIKVNGVRFNLVNYLDKKGESRPMYQLSKTECLYIATKFNDEARARLILRWESLENTAKSPAEQLLQNAQLLVEQERRVNQIEEKVKVLEAKTVTRPDYFTIAGYATLNGMNVNLKIASRLGRAASKLCKDRGLLTDSIPDARYGKVKMYPTVVLEDVFRKEVINA